MLVWIFQDGHLQGLLGFHSNGAVVTWLPLFLFAVLFGLSMDYHVFIVSRIKELRDGGLSTADAVAQGIRTTAGTVTAAAAVMVGGVRDLRVAAYTRHQADGCGTRGRRAARRHRHPRGVAARHDEAAGRMELVPAALAALAPQRPARVGADRTGRGGGMTMAAIRQTARPTPPRTGTSGICSRRMPLGLVWFVALVTVWSLCLGLRGHAAVHPARDRPGVHDARVRRGGGRARAIAAGDRRAGSVGPGTGWPVLGPLPRDVRRPVLARPGVPADSVVRWVPARPRRAGRAVVSVAMISAPIWLPLSPSPADLGIWKPHTLLQSLAFVPAGLLLLPATLLLVRPLARIFRPIVWSLLPASNSLTPAPGDASTARPVDRMRP